MTMSMGGKLTRKIELGRTETWWGNCRLCGRLFHVCGHRVELRLFEVPLIVLLLPKQAPTVPSLVAIITLCRDEFFIRIQAHLAIEQLPGD